MTVFTTAPDLTKRLLKAQYSMHIEGAGYANLLPAVPDTHLIALTWRIICGTET